MTATVYTYKTPLHGGYRNTLWYQHNKSVQVSKVANARRVMAVLSEFLLGEITPESVRGFAGGKSALWNNSNQWKVNGRVKNVGKLMAPGSR